MSIKLIALDLDGTLMLPDHITVSERNKSVLKKAHDMGVTIMISTGRTLSVVTRVLEQIPFTDFVMYSDGAAVYDVKNGEVIYQKLIDYDVTKKVIDFLNTKQVYYNIYLNQKIVTQNGRQRFFTGSGLPDEFINDYVNNTVVYDSLLDSINGVKSELIVGFFNSEKDYKESMEFISEFSDKLYVTSAFRNEFEMTDIEANKGKTLEYVCSHIGIDKSEVIAFGDSHNDMPMLLSSGIAVAMGNAEKEVKEIADFVTETNAYDGVAVAIENYVLE